jgi:outer membrane protein OmpA-like peptidoglycan-associated protein
MKNLKLLAIVAFAAFAFGACKTSKMPSNSGVMYQTDVVTTNDLKGMNYPLADSIMKYSMSGNADAVLTNEMVSLSKAVTDNMFDKASVSQFGQGVVVSFNKGNVFGVDDFTLNEETKSALRNLAFNLNQNPQSYIVVFGRADATGSADHNETLAYKRAATVANYLSGCAINKDRLFVESFGEKYPDYKNSTSINKNKNRRVDIMIIPSNEMRANSGR